MPLPAPRGAGPSGMRTLLQGLPQLLQRPLLDAGYIGPGDAEGGGNLPLGQGNGSSQTVPQADDLGLPGGQALVDQAAELERCVPVVEILQHGVIHPYHVHQLQGVALLVRVDGVRQGDLTLELFLAAEVHQDLVFNTPGGVGGQPGALLRVKAGDPLDEADGADGDEILLIGALGIVLFEQVKQKEEFARSKMTPQGSPNFKYMSKWNSSFVLPFLTTI